MISRRIVAKIDADPRREGLEHARRVCARWVERGNVPAREWMEILRRPWTEIRAILLGDAEESRRLRQNDPFCGILTPRERWKIYREAAAGEALDAPAKPQRLGFLKGEIEVPIDFDRMGEDEIDTMF